MELIVEFILDFIGDIAEILLNKHLKTNTAKLLFVSFMILGLIALTITMFLKESYEMGTALALLILIFVVSLVWYSYRKKYSG